MNAIDETALISLPLQVKLVYRNPVVEQGALNIKHRFRCPVLVEEADAKTALHFSFQRTSCAAYLASGCCDPRPDSSIDPWEER